jgi:hypothetical protein
MAKLTRTMTSPAAAHHQQTKPPRLVLDYVLKEESSSPQSPLLQQQQQQQQQQRNMNVTRASDNLEQLYSNNVNLRKVHSVCVPATRTSTTTTTTYNNNNNKQHNVTTAVTGLDKIYRTPTTAALVGPPKPKLVSKAEYTTKGKAVEQQQPHIRNVKDLFKSDELQSTINFDQTESPYVDFNRLRKINMAVAGSAAAAPRTGTPPPVLNYTSVEQPGLLKKKEMSSASKPATAAAVAATAAGDYKAQTLDRKKFIKPINLKTCSSPTQTSLLLNSRIPMSVNSLQPAQSTPHATRPQQYNHHSQYTQIQSHYHRHQNNTTGNNASAAAAAPQPSPQAIYNSQQRVFMEKMHGNSVNNNYMKHESGGNGGGMSIRKAMDYEMVKGKTTPGGINDGERTSANQTLHYTTFNRYKQIKGMMANGGNYTARAATSYIGNSGNVGNAYGQHFSTTLTRTGSKNGSINNVGGISNGGGGGGGPNNSPFVFRSGGLKLDNSLMTRSYY